MHLPRDHTSGGAAGQHTPRTMVADNDLALGRIVEALSRSPFWEGTVAFVIEDDVQNGPDHVDSHRSPLLVISPWARPGICHRFGNTTDVPRTMLDAVRGRWAVATSPSGQVAKRRHRGAATRTRPGTCAPKRSRE